MDFNFFAPIGDGKKDDTTAIQHLLDQASLNNSVLLLSGKKTYLVSSLRLKNGIKSFLCEGVIKGMGNSTHGIISFDGPIFGGKYVSNCTISVNLDLSAGDSFGIFAYGCTNCVFQNNYIYGLTNSNKVSRFGIYLRDGANYNKIINNKIVGFEKPNSKFTSVLIALFGKSEEFGGFFNNGKITPPTLPCVGNIISNNNLYYSKVAIDLLACSNTTVLNNYCYKQLTRAIYLANSTNNSLVNENQCIGFGASAICMAYGAFNNKIINNAFTQILGYNPVGGEAAINIYTGAYGNIITNNIINSATNYGIYLAVNVINNTIDDNTISGYFLAGIALENDWMKTPPQDAKYSRPNYEKPLLGNSWATLDSKGNKIINNIIGKAYPGRDTREIYISQLGKTKTRDNIISNNRSLENKSNKDIIYLYESVNDGLRNSIKDN